MKSKTLLLAVTLSALPLSALHAEDSHHPDSQNASGAMQGGMNDGMGMMGNMQQHMKIMMQQMSKIRDTKDPDERDRLMEEHMKTMQEGMKMMGGGMMGGGMMGAPGKDNAMNKDDMKQRMNMMENRMNMMQGMMNQMMESDMETVKTTKLRKQHKKK